MTTPITHMIEFRCCTTCVDLGTRRKRCPQRDGELSRSEPCVTARDTREIANPYMLLLTHMSRTQTKLAHNEPLESVWQGLSDPTRRAILDLLRAGPRTTGELVARYPFLSRYAVMKHLDVLVAAGLVVVRREGRERWNRLNVIPLQQIYEHWVRPFEAVWATPLLHLKHELEHPSPYADVPDPSVTNLRNPVAGIANVHLEISITASAERVWRALTTQVALWWPKEFYASNRPQHMRLDARLGGQLTEEDSNGGGVLWYTVYGLSVGQSIDMVGQLSPAFGGPAQSYLRLELREHEHHTVLVLTDAVVGNVGERTRESVTSGWDVVFGQAFKKFVESNG